MKDKDNLSGIQRLALAEIQAIHHRDMNESYRRAEVDLLEGVEALVNGCSFYDDQGTSRKPTQEVSDYVDRMNRELTRQNNPFSEFHEQERGKLSKNPRRRQTIISERIIKSVTKNPYER